MPSGHHRRDRGWEQSWTEVLLDLKAQGVKSPRLAVGDGALGFWEALRKVLGQTRSQRCWVHKTANVLNKLPKRSQSKAKQGIHDIWMAQTGKMPRKRLICSLRPTMPSIPKPLSVLRKLERNCWHSMIFLPIIGCIFVRPIRLNRHFPLCG